MKDEDSAHISEVAKKKAELIHYGKIYVPDSIKLPYPLSSSTAGPGAGKKAFALSFGGTRLKLGFSKDKDSKFSLKKNGDGFQIIKDKEVYVHDVEIIPTLLHAPNQAFVNLRDGCIYSCSFCATPILDEAKKKTVSPEQIVNMILKASNQEDFQSVAITSGIVGSPAKTLDEILWVVKKVKENLGEVEIGVEPYVSEAKDIQRLHDAGATEIKINIESYDRDIFNRICPELDYDHILKMLKEAAMLFGRGKVTTNILVGLGESDNNVLDGVEYFAKRGVVAVIRILRLNDYNHRRIVDALGHDVEKVPLERMMDLAIKQKGILERYGLSTMSFKTMCHKCGCCDIVPFKDV
ncbi:MAG: radical SAM protein [Methanomassiliicoccales archaeon]|nr:MAG: radical SAM protein [Methanomassiliicoccales archaeon]